MNVRLFAAALALGLAALPLTAPAADEMKGHAKSASDGISGHAMGNENATPLKSVGGPLPAALQGKPVLAKIHADWCPACKATQPTVDAVVAHYGNKITFVKFDVTDAKTAADSAALAKKDGLSKFYDAEKAATSTIAVIDPKTGNIVQLFYNQGDQAAYEAAIDKALALNKT